MRVLVTGGAGFIGSHLVQELKMRSADVWVWDNLSTSISQTAAQARERLEVSVVHMNAADLPVVDFDFEPDWVVHLAAHPSVAKSQTTDAIKDQVSDMDAVLRFCQLRRCNLLFASSGGTVYGEADLGGSQEDDPLRPVSRYGAGKAACEMMVRAHQHNYPDQKSIIVRLANVFGLGQNPVSECGVVAIWLDQVLHGRPSVMYGNGSQIRDFVHVGCVSESIADLIWSGLGAGRSPLVVNVGSGRPTPISEVRRCFEMLFGSRFQLEERPARDYEIHTSLLDIRRLRGLVGPLRRSSLEGFLAQYQRG